MAFDPGTPQQPVGNPEASGQGPAVDYYSQLLARADEFMATLKSRHPDSLACREGCSACCRLDLAIFPVEADRVRQASQALGEEIRHLLAADPVRGHEACPFLVRDRCVIYRDRPLICRTHGAPVLVREEEAERVDVCPLNFQREAGAIPPVSVLDLDRLNEILVAVNVYHCRRQGQDPGARSTMSRILASVLGSPGQGGSQVEEVS